MQHRHININEWTKMAIDSCLERGDLSDWQELFQAAKNNTELAKDILYMARQHEEDGTAELVEGLIKKLHPELFTSDVKN
jgi:hypothetical protein